MKVEQFDNVVIIRVNASDLEIKPMLDKEIEKWESRFYKVTNEIHGLNNFITVMETN